MIDYQAALFDGWVYFTLQSYAILRVNQSCGGVEVIVQVHHADRLAELAGQAALDSGDGIIIVEGNVLEQPSPLTALCAHDAHITHGGDLLIGGVHNALGFNKSSFK